jgi:hypothetical protein
MRVLFQPCLQVHASAGIALGGYCRISLSASTAAREEVTVKTDRETASSTAALLLLHRILELQHVGKATLHRLHMRV